MDDNRRKQLLEQYEDVALSLLMDDYANNAGKCLLQEFEDAQKNGDLGEIPPELDKMCRQLIDETFAKQERMLQMKRISNALARVAVVALVVLGLSTMTVLSVDAFRIPVLNFLMDQSGRYSTLSFDLSVNIDSTCTNRIVELFQSNLPDGYEVFQNTFIENKGTIFCANETENILYLEVTRSEREINIDTEDIPYTELEFSGYAAVFQYKNGHHLRWLDSETETLYTLFSNGLDIDAFWKLAYTIVG